MQKPSSKKPARRAPAATAYRRTSIEEETAGRLYRVRCKDWENLWGENLTHEEATRLKEQVCTRGKSRTARVEDMEIPAPDWYLAQEGIEALPVATPASTIVDAELERLRQKALAASHASAQTAQDKHARHAARDRSSVATAGKKGPVGIKHTGARTVPVIAGGDVSDDDAPIDDGDLADLLADADSSSEPTEAELAHAKATANANIAEITETARLMYETQSGPSRPSWESLTKAEQATWRFQATATSRNGAGNVGSRE